MTSQTNPEAAALGVRKPATIDSARYKATFYGILNAQGDFWTPIPFDSEKAARAWMDAFWGPDIKNRDQCRRTHKIVPVRVRLTRIASLAQATSPPPAIP